MDNLNADSFPPPKMYVPAKVCIEKVRNDRSERSTHKFEHNPL